MSESDLSPGDFVVVDGICNAGESDYDIDDPTDGQIGVVIRVIKNRYDDSSIIRLIHREPVFFHKLSKDAENEGKTLEQVREKGVRPSGAASATLEASETESDTAHNNTLNTDVADNIKGVEINEDINKYTTASEGRLL